MHALIASAVAILALRLAWIFVAFARGADGYGRHHVEAAAVWFTVACGLSLVAGTQRPDAEPEAPESPLWRRSWIFLVGAVAAAGACYFPALSLGWLSDDWGLIVRADRWQIGAVTPTLFRPIPLAIWAAMRDVGMPVAAFHGLNILLHAIAAFLIRQVLREWRIDEPWPTVGGAFALVSPIAVEPVAWASSVFDLFAAVCLLAAVLTRTPWRVVVLLAVAMLCKETAFIGPMLVLVAAWAGGRAAALPARTRALVAMVVVGIAYALVRAWMSDTHPPVDRYVIQRAIFSDLGTRARPFHELFIAVHPRLTLLYGLGTIALLAAFALIRTRAVDARAAAAGAVWMLIPLAAIFPVMPVGGDLQGARYLYFGQLGWCAVVAAAGAALVRTRLEYLGRGVAVCLLAAAMVATRAHLRPWVDAAATRSAVIASAASALRTSPCNAIALRDLPDAVDGAYVFRNSVGEAFAETIGAAVVDDGAAPGCTFRWSARERRVIRE